MNNNYKAPPFFIVGSQRSGSTLLRLILNSHSLYAVPEEARFLTPILKQRYLRTTINKNKLSRIKEYLENNNEYKQWNYDNKVFLNHLRNITDITLRDLIDNLYYDFAKHECKSSWGDKSLFFQQINFLSRLFPNSKFIHIVRDGRDVFSSWRKMDPSKNNAAAAAIDWNYKLHKINRSFSNLPKERYITIRYEDLLSEPNNTIRAICEFLSIDFEPSMLDYHKTSQFYIGQHHSQLIFKAIDAKNKNKWRTELKPDEIIAFELLSSKYLHKYNYEPSRIKVRLIQLPKLFINIIKGVPYRAYKFAAGRLRSSLSLKRSNDTQPQDLSNMPKPRDTN